MTFEEMESILGDAVAEIHKRAGAKGAHAREANLINFESEGKPGGDDYTATHCEIKFECDIVIPIKEKEVTDNSKTLQPMSNHNEFNYEAAKNGAPVMTRDGRPANIICWHLSNNTYCIAAEILHKGEDDEEYPIYTYTEQGFYRARGGYSENDLIMAPVIHSGWTLIHTGDNLDEAAAERVAHGKRLATAVVFDTMEQAEKACEGRDDVTIAELTWTD